ncbi:MAG: tryptophan synthase subunit alpha [Bacteroidetes bacterium]|nr:tryptophan synthase subunit alpha [Bacteroidota bacterium]
MDQANRINRLFKEKQDILSVYFTAGFPHLDDTGTILAALQQGGADLVEIGIPYSDPVADGPTIQESNQEALNNGMTIIKLFEQLHDIRSSINIPLILMGYINPVMQYGIENFCKSCQEVGIDGLILPDLPMYEYLSGYKDIFKKYGLHNIFLITPQTSEERIKEIDQHSYGFIYMVSSASITGAKGELTNDQIDYFERVKAMKIKNPTVIGFGISNHETFSTACKYADGAIIGSAFINLLKESTEPIQKSIRDFINTIRARG